LQVTGSALGFARFGVLDNLLIPENLLSAISYSTPTSGTAPAPVVDVTAILDGLSAKSSEKLDWRNSIVDLMKLVGMDSSYSARVELAKELQYTGSTSDSAAMNIWLHKQVIKKIAENGGKVPQDLLKS
jgi:uncharacterized protein DUF3597